MTRSSEHSYGRSPFLVLIGLAVSPWGLSCGSAADEPAAGGDQAASEVLEHTAAAPEPQAGAGDSVLFEKRQRNHAEWKADNLRRADPGYDGWRSEVLHDRANEALEHFLSAAVHPNGDEPGWAEHLSPSFRGATPLRPDELERLFDDGATEVLRPTSIEGDLRDPAAFAGQLADLLRPFEGAEELEVASKILKVDVDGGRFETVVKVEIDGLVDGSPVQQNSDWRAGWVAGEGEEVLLESLHLLAFEEVRTRRGLFGEVTRHVFGDHDFWDMEFRLGTGDYYFKLDKLGGNAFIGGQGIAVGDVNADGLDDVYVCQQGGIRNRLFIHQADGTAVDVAPAAGVDILDNTRSALIVDLDGDGNQDLALAIRNSVLLCFGDGEGGFVDFRPLTGRGAEDIFSLTAADPDLDGDLDLYGCRYVKDGIIRGVPVPYHDANNGASNLFWTNAGGREFSDGTRGNGLSRNNSKFSLASIWEDFDLDGDADLYVSNDFGRNNLYRNNGTRFRDVATEAGADDMAAGMGATSADIDLDGYPDLYVTNMFSSAGLRIASVSEQFMGGENEEVHGHYVRHARGNTLLCNRGDGTFEDVTETAGVAIGRWGWGAHFIELNNDGLEDIYVPNGFITNTDSKDL